MDKRAQIRTLFTPAERKVLDRLSTPKKIQDFLESFPVRFVGRGEKDVYSPRQVLKERRAQCLEGALFAAAALAYHGEPPILLDLQAAAHDADHVVALFKKDGLWGAISKTNYPVLRWRDPIYKSTRELAMSYVHEYFMWYGTYAGQKTMRAYSKPFSLERYKAAQWVGAEDLDWLAEDLDNAPHFPIAPKEAIRRLRPATRLERVATDTTEWTKSGKKRRL